MSRPEAQPVTLLDQILALSADVDKMGEAIGQLDARARRLEELRSEIHSAQTTRSARIRELLDKAGTGTRVPALAAELRATEEAAELEYLRLQSAMQRESRAYNAISNVLKTKHDSVKNSIGNIR